MLAVSGKEQHSDNPSGLHNIGPKILEYRLMPS